MTPLRDVARAQRLVECGVITEKASCLSKVSFAVRNHALNAAKGVSNKTGRQTEIYKCGFCAHWHITKVRHGDNERGSDVK